MTPDLAGFVVAADEAVWADVLDHVRAALRANFELVPERAGAGAQRRTWFDTFDWRLYRAGLSLEYVTAHRASTLVLTGAGANGDPNRGASGRAVQPVTGWQPARTHHGPDIPNGPIADRISDLIHPRALLPVVTVASTAEVARLLNDDGKTVARLIIERPVIGNRPLPPRIAIAEVRGYGGQARRATRIVAMTPGVEPGPEATSAEARLLDDALRAIGRRAGDYSNKVSAKITAEMPADRAVATILIALLDNLEANVDGVLRDTDTEFLHDLRVSVRRTRAAIKLLGDALGLTTENVERFAVDFKWLGDLTTPVRDLDVHLLGFGEMAATLKAAKQDDLEPFRAFLAQRRAREFRLLVRGLRSQQFAELTRDWRAALTAILDSAKKRVRRQPEPMTAGQLAIGRTRRAFRKVRGMGAAITPDSPHESLHDLRKRCKELRYVLEFFAPLHDKAAYAAVLGDLKGLQDCLGEFQDNEVQIDEIRAMAGAMHEAGVAPIPTLLALGELTAGLAARQEAARAVFEARFARFAGPQGRLHMGTLLGARDTGHAEKGVDGRHGSRTGNGSGRQGGTA